jgi:PEP-CTERM motif
MKFKQIAAALLLAYIGTANAAPIIINPTSDGSLYTCVGCNTIAEGGAMVISGYVQGAVKFSSADISGPVESALLSLNPLALPLWGPTVDIYGYGTTIGALDESDANAGTFLGTLILPTLDFGQDVFFDVTGFVSNTSAPFLAFNLRTVLGGTDVFSTLEENYGHPAQLTITMSSQSVPEPSTVSLFAAAILGAIFFSRRRNATR